MKFWVENANDADGRIHGKVSSKRVKVFFSANKKKSPKFDGTPQADFDSKQDGCYFGFVLNICGNCQQTKSAAASH